MEEVDASGMSSPALVSPISGQSSPTNYHMMASHASTAPPSTVVSPSSLSPSGLMPAVSAASSNTDFVTPLKKRRMVRESLSLDENPTSPDLPHTHSSNNTRMDTGSVTNIAKCPATPPRSSVTAATPSSLDLSSSVNVSEAQNTCPEQGKPATQGVGPETTPSVEEIPSTVAEYVHTPKVCILFYFISSNEHAQYLSLLY